MSEVLKETAQAAVPAKERIVETIVESIIDGEMILPLRRFCSTVFAQKRREFLGKSQADRIKLARDHMVENLCDLIAGEPVNVPGFPVDDRPLSARMRAYGADPAYDEIIESIYNGYWAQVTPSPLFRKSVPSSDEGTAGA